MSMTRHVLLVGSGGHLPARFQEAYPHVRTSVLCTTRTASRLRQPDKHDMVVALDPEADVTEWVAAAEFLAARGGAIDAVACFGERSQDRAADLAVALNLEWHTPHTVHLVNNKVAMRKRLNTDSVDHTRAVDVQKPEDIRAFLASVSGPVVVKPADSTASIGVSVIYDPSHAEDAFGSAQENRGWGSGVVMAEEFLEGPQLSVECVSGVSQHHVVGIVRKFSHPWSHVELGHVCPWPFTKKERDSIQELVSCALNSLGITFGPTHTEVVLTDQGPRVLETHLRVAGDGIPLLVKDATGVDIEAATLAQVLDYSAELPELNGQPGEASAIWFIGSKLDGTVTNVQGIEEGRAADGVTDVQVSVRAGDNVHVLAASQDRMGQATARASSPQQALDRARHAAELIRIDVAAQLTYGDTV